MYGTDLRFWQNLPTSQETSLTALGPIITTWDAISITTWWWYLLCCHRVYYQMARVAEDLLSKFHEDWGVFHWLRNNLWLFIKYGNVHWGYEEGMNGVWSKKMDKQMRNGHFPSFPLCDFLGPASSAVSAQKQFYPVSSPPLWILTVTLLPPCKNKLLMPYICVDIYWWIWYRCMTNLHDGKLMAKSTQLHMCEPSIINARYQVITVLV